MKAIRVTPMLLTQDVDASAKHYAQLGFSLKETEDPQCLGLVAKDGTGIILLGDRYARHSMPAQAVEALAGNGGLYIWADDLNVPGEGEVLGDIRTDYGTRERFVKRDGKLIVYAQKLAA